MIVVAADGPWRGDVGNVDNAETAVPDRGAKPIAPSHGVVQAIVASLPVRNLAAGEVLAGQPPA